MKNYEVLEHTADIGIRVKSLSLKGLFKKAGLAITKLSATKERNQYSEKHRIVIMQKAANVEELFVNWLNELLSVSAAEALIFEDFKINQINEQFVDAIAVGFSSRDYKTNIEIKAATYHQLKVQKINFFWQAEIIFDV